MMRGFSKSNLKVTSKKGELSTAMIIGLIILIVSFIVILFFILELGLKEKTAEEICHNSVVMYSKSSLLGRLDCKTEYVCISGGEDCTDFSPTKTIEVDLSKGNDEVLRAIADEMANCWWMFGEGKINYASRKGGMHCAICSMVKFDSGGVNIKHKDLHSFLASNNKSGSQTYLEYFYGVSDLNKFYEINPMEKEVSNEPILNSEKYAILTGQDWFFTSNMFYRVRLIKSTDISDKEISKCDYFDITKA
ncbi:MAG: hypothetical protein AABX88_02615 [Nanoarchaeota archaeon]